MILGSAALLLLLAAARADEESTTTTSAALSAATTLGTLFRQARSEQHFYASTAGAGASASRYTDEGPILGARSDPLEHRDSAYFESRCITCDPRRTAPQQADREWRQRGKYDYYDEEYDDRRYRDRYDPYYERARSPAYEYDRYDPYNAKNELFRPSAYNDRYDPYERDRYYGRPVDRPMDRPLLETGYPDRGADRPIDRPLADRPYERGNGYDNLDQRYAYDDRYGPPRRPAYEEYGPARYDRYNGNRNYGRYDSRYDRYDAYDRNGYRRPVYDDRYDRYGGGSRLPPAPDSRGYYGTSAGWSSPGSSDRPAYASAWNYASGNRDSWRDVNRERDRDRDRDRDAGFYRPRDYFYDSTAAPGGSRGTSYLYDRPESSTKPDADRDKPTNSPQTQDNGKTYKD